jgi:hypothetical protein
VELVEQFLDILGKQTKIIDQMADMSSGKNSLVSKNIIKSPNSTLDAVNTPSRLDSKERKRLDESSSIFIAKFFEEQKKQRKDTAEKTLTSKLSKPIIKQNGGTNSGKDGSSSGWLSKLLGLLGLGFLKPEALKGLLKKGLAKLAEKLKGVLSSIWKGIKGFFGKLWSGIKSMASKIWNSKFVKGLRGIFSKAWSKIKGVFGSIKNRIVGLFKSVGKYASGLWKGITNSKAYKAFSAIINSAKEAISKIFQGIKNKIGSVIKSATDGISKVVPGGVKTAAKAVTATAGGVVKTAAKAVTATAGGVAKKAGGWLSKIGSGIRSTAGKAVGGVVSAGKAVGGAAVSAAKGVVSTAAKGVIKGSGGMLKLMGRLTAKGAAKIPIIGPAIEAAFTASDIKKLKAQGLTDSELQQQAGRRVISGVSGMVGSAGGAVLAGALGSIIPGAGTAIGTIIGAIGGDLAGRFLGGLITDYIIPKKYTKTIGAFVTGTTPPKDEMQDFIIKNGKVYKFNKQDEVMGMKTGGAINEFLRGGSGNNQTMRVMVKANSISIQYLRAIAHNTAMMVQKFSNPQSGGNSIIVSNSQQPQSSPKQMETIPNNRSGFTSSPYAIG